MLFMILTLVLLIACGTEKVAAKEVKTAKNNTTINSNKKILIAYFSLSGNTENFANQIGCYCCRGVPACVMTKLPRRKN